MGARDWGDGVLICPPRPASLLWRKKGT